MRRLVAILLPLAALLAGVAVVGLASPGVEPCVAQGATSPDLEARVDCGAGASGPGAGAAAGTCATNTTLRGVSARRRGRGLRLAFTRRGAGAVTVDVFQTSSGRRILGQRRVKRFARRSRSFAWSGRRGSDGIYLVRFRASGAETQRVALRRRGRRFSVRPAFERRVGCGAIRAFKLERPVFGGRTNRSLGIAYRLNVAGRVTLSVLRRGRVVRSLKTTTDQLGRTYRARLGSERLRRGDHQIRLTVRPAGGAAPVSARLTAARL